MADVRQSFELPGDAADLIVLNEKHSIPSLEETVLTFHGRVRKNSQEFTRADGWKFHAFYATQ
jgi:hypothetical protein